MNTQEQHYAQVRYSTILQSKQMLTAVYKMPFHSITLVKKLKYIHTVKKYWRQIFELHPKTHLPSYIHYCNSSGYHIHILPTQYSKFLNIIRCSLLCLHKEMRNTEVTALNIIDKRIHSTAVFQ